VLTLVIELIWDGTNLNGRTVVSGVYVYTIQTGDFQHTKKADCFIRLLRVKKAQ